MQPQQGGQAADGGDFRTEVTADDVGVDHGLAHDAGGLGGMDRQGPYQHGGHVVHDRRQASGEQPRPEGGAPDPVAGEDIEDLRQVVGEAGVTQAIDHEVHAKREHHDLPRRVLEHLAG
ncbi:hypothetical protein D3C81_680270 [compost metagenome]